MGLFLTYETWIDLEGVANLSSSLLSSVAISRLLMVFDAWKEVHRLGEWHQFVGKERSAMKSERDRLPLTIKNRQRS